MKILTKRNRKKIQKLNLILKKRRQRFEKKRRLEKTKNRILNEKLILINVQKKHLMKTFNHDYIYNIIIKHFMFNEKSSK